MTTEYVGQNESFGVEIAHDEPHRSAPHVVLIPSFAGATWGDEESALESREYRTLSAARKAATRYLESA